MFMVVEEERDTQEDARVQERTEMEHEVARRELGEKDAYRHETCGWTRKIQTFVDPSADYAMSSSLGGVQ